MKRRCPVCGSTHVHTEVASSSKTRKKGKGLMYWIYMITFGWVIELMMWFFFFNIKLFFWLFKRTNYDKRYDTTNYIHTYLVCDNCGEVREINKKKVG